jgi:hypothetical protein
MKGNVGYAALVRGLGALIIALGFAGSAWTGEVGSGKSKTLPDCGDLLGDLLGGNTCSDSNLFSSKPRVLAVLDPDKPNFNPKLCTCNVKFVKCNPASTKGGCLSGKPLKAFPGNLDLVNDGTTVCLTIGGQRNCWTR